jgi:hypothetical protein
MAAGISETLWSIEGGTARIPTRKKIQPEMLPRTELTINDGLPRPMRRKADLDRRGPERDPRWSCFRPSGGSAPKLARNNSADRALDRGLRLLGDQPEWFALRDRLKEEILRDGVDPVGYHLPDVESVAEQVGKRTARERNAADLRSRLEGANLGHDALFAQVGHEQA